MSTWLQDPHPAPPAPHQPLSSAGPPTAALRFFSVAPAALLTLLLLAVGLAVPLPTPSAPPQPPLAASDPGLDSEADGDGGAGNPPDDPVAVAPAGEGGETGAAAGAAAEGGDSGEGGSTTPLARGDHCSSRARDSGFCCCWCWLLSRRPAPWLAVGGATPKRAWPPRLRTSSRPWSAAICSRARARVFWGGEVSTTQREVKLC